MTEKKSDDDLFVFKDEIESSSTHSNAGEEVSPKQRLWRVLIADDDADVHEATKFALKHTEILGRKLEFLDAYNSIEAIEILRTVPDIAVVFLDVVMETSNAGLDAVPIIREELGLNDTRIVLRTGEPNQAPVLKVIREYDINDYKLKSELTQNQLFATLTSAIRSYKQIRTIEDSKKGLNLILKSSSELLTQEGLRGFAEGVIVHLAALLSVPQEGLICVRRKDSPANDDELVIIAAAGDYCSLVDRPLHEVTETLAQNLLRQSLDNHCNVFHKLGVALYLGSSSRGDMSCFIASGDEISEVDQGLLEVFCGNISLCADNINFLDRLKQYAFTDELVGLPNRNSLEEIISAHIQRKSSIPHALALLDIDNFAEINAVLGQEYGDKLLCASADRIKAQFAEHNFVARVSGDTFAVFGPSSYISQGALLQPFVNPFQIGGELQLLSITAGLVPLAEISGGGDEAIKDASIILKKAKNTNRGQVVVFSRDVVTDARGRLEMLKNLRTAFEGNQLFLVFQPKLRLDDLSVTGFEALLRWKGNDGNYISPAEFIPLAEQSGLIIRMGEWVLRSALAELALLRAKGYSDVKMAINLSVAQLEHPDMMGMLRRVIGASDIHPSFIELEITESVAMGDVMANIQRLQEIRDIGFQLSMDDFGTGFSSLTYLQKMPINCLKIDRAFVNTSDTKSGREIVEMIVQLGKTLGLRVIAEGVEEAREGELLKGMGCHEVQGFYYAKPMPRETLLEWLSKHA